METGHSSWQVQCHEKEFQSNWFRHSCLLKAQLGLCYGFPVTVTGNYADINRFSVSEPPFTQIRKAFTVINIKVEVGDRFYIFKTGSPSLTVK
jgi:hypothetical protein